MKSNPNQVASNSAGLNQSLNDLGFSYNIVQAKPEVHVNPIHTTLDLSTLLGFFGQMVEQLFYWEGLRYRNGKYDVCVLLGTEAPHAITESLSLDGEPLGAISVMKNKAFTDEEKSKFDYLSKVLLYPLRNALLYQQALNLAMHDPLTRVGNRNALNQHLEREVSLAFRHDTPFSCLMIDIDFFKLINDKHGHAAGDDALRFTADQIGDCLRCSDLLFRLGGEEFLCLLPSTQLDGAEILAERIRAHIDLTHCRQDSLDIHLTVSIGVAQLLVEDDGKRLIDRADKALNRAKNSGRNRVCTG